MVSLRDPVRDNLLFVDFAQGAAAGCRAAGRAQRLQLRAADRQAELRAAARQLRAFGAAGAVRLRARHQRRQGESLRLPAGGDHPRCCWCFSWRAISPRAGTCCATRARRRPSLAALTTRFDIPPVEYTLPVLVSVVLSPGLLLPAKGHGAGAGVRLPVPGRCTASRAAAPSCPLAGLALLALGLRRRLSASACRTPSATASPCGFLPGTTWCTAAISWRTRSGRSPPAASPGTGIGLGDAAARARGAYRPDPRRARRRVGLPRHRGGLRAVRVAGLPRACASPCARAPITNSSWPRDSARPPRCRSC